MPWNMGLLFEQCQLQYVGSDQIESGCFTCSLHLHGSLKGTIAKIKNKNRQKTAHL